MPSTIPSPSFTKIAGGGFVDAVIAFLQNLPTRLHEFGGSSGYINWVYFLWALTIILLGFVIYLAIKKYDLEEREQRGFYQNFIKEEFESRRQKKYSKVWGEIAQALKSSNVSDWKVAILEADSILDEIIKSRGYPGENVGERLKAIPKGEIATLEDAWTAHKLRNRIAHEGAQFQITRTEFADTIARLERVFREFDCI